MKQEQSQPQEGSRKFTYFPNHGDEDGRNCYTVCYGEPDDDNFDEIIVAAVDTEEEAIEAIRRLNGILELFIPIQPQEEAKEEHEIKIEFGNSFITIGLGAIWFDGYDFGMGARKLKEVYDKYVHFNNNPFDEHPETPIQQPAKKPLSLKECKQKIAEKYGESKWTDLLAFNHPKYNIIDSKIERAYDEAAEMYANQPQPVQPVKEGEYIICAAIHFNDGKTYNHQPKNITSGFVIAGRRHHNCYTTFQSIGKALGYQETLIVKKGVPLEEREVQGFLTNLDRFVDRKEGWEIALSAHQVKPREYNTDLDKVFDEPLPKGTKMILISEDLY